MLPSGRYHTAMSSDAEMKRKLRFSCCVMKYDILNVFFCKSGLSANLDECGFMTGAVRFEMKTA